MTLEVEGMHGLDGEGKQQAGAVGPHTFGGFTCRCRCSAGSRYGAFKNATVIVNNHH